TPRTLLVSAGCFATLLLIVSLLPWYSLALVALVVMGVFSVTYSAVTNTILQLNSDEEYRGRVLSLYTLLFAGSTPIGGALTGWLADRWGIRDALALEAGPGVLAALFGLPWAPTPPPPAS